MPRSGRTSRGRSSTWSADPDAAPASAVRGAAGRRKAVSTGASTGSRVSRGGADSYMPPDVHSVVKNADDVHPTAPFTKQDDMSALRIAVQPPLYVAALAPKRLVCRQPCEPGDHRVDTGVRPFGSPGCRTVSPDISKVVPGGTGDAIDHVPRISRPFTLISSARVLRSLPSTSTNSPASNASSPIRTSVRKRSSFSASASS